MGSGCSLPGTANGKHWNHTGALSRLQSSPPLTQGEQGDASCRALGLSPLSSQAGWAPAPRMTSSVPRASPWFPWHWAPAGPKSSVAAPAPIPQQGLTLLLPAASKDQNQTPPVLGHRQHHLPMDPGQHMQHCWAHQSSVSSSQPIQDPADPQHGSTPPIPTWGARLNCQRNGMPEPPYPPWHLQPAQSSPPFAAVAQEQVVSRQPGAAPCPRGVLLLPPHAAVFTGAAPVLQGLCACRKPAGDAHGSSALLPAPSRSQLPFLLAQLPGRKLPCWVQCSPCSATGTRARHLIPLEAPSISSPWLRCWGFRAPWIPLCSSRDQERVQAEGGQKQRAA